MDRKGEQLDLGDDPDRFYLRKCWEKFISMEGKEVTKAVKTFTARVREGGTGSFSDMGVALGQREKENLVETVKTMEDYYPGDGSTFATL